MIPFSVIICFWGSEEDKTASLINPLFYICFLTHIYFFVLELAEMVQFHRYKSLLLYYKDIWNIIDQC